MCILLLSHKDNTEPDISFSRTLFPNCATQHCLTVSLTRENVIPDFAGVFLGQEPTVREWQRLSDSDEKLRPQLQQGKAMVGFSRVQGERLHLLAVASSA